MVNLLSNSLKNSIKSTYIYYWIFASMFNIILLFFIYNFAANYVHKEILYDIIKNKKINLNEICASTSCDEISYNYIAYKNISNRSKHIDYIYGIDDLQDIHTSSKLIKINKLTYNLTNILNFEVIINVPEYKIKIKTHTSIFLKNLCILIIFFNIILYFIIRNIIVILLNKIKKDDVISMAGKEAYLVNKNMSLLTAHVTHEVKTPLAVLNNQLHVIRDYYEDLLEQVNKIKHPSREIDKIILGSIGTSTNNCITNPKIDEAFSTAEIYIDSIQNVLNRMQNFKEIKYSNGNKDLYTLVEVSFKTLMMYHKGVFEYNIDKKLKGIHISEKLANADILHIFLNHIKNSLQANTTYINVSTSTVKDSKITVYMTDNGNGIPIDKLRYIFDPKFSTKSHKTNDGVGLYISKQILVQAGGNESVQESSNKGTVFKFILPIKDQTT